MKYQVGDMWKLREVWRKMYKTGTSDYVRRTDTGGNGSWNFTFSNADEEAIEKECEQELEGMFTAMLDAAFMKPEVYTQDGFVRIKCHTKEFLHYDIEIAMNPDDALDCANMLKMAVQNLKTLEITKD